MMRCLDEKLGQLQDMTPYFAKVMERIATPDWEMTEAAPDTHSLIFIYDGWMILDVNGREYLLPGRSCVSSTRRTAG